MIKPEFVQPRATRSSSFSSCIPYSGKSKRKAFALFAFNNTSESDVIRMLALKDIYSVRVTCASEQEVHNEQTKESDPFHYSCDFKVSLMRGFDSKTVVLMLDYFWLQCDWWNQRYGKNWILPSSKSKILQAFQSSSTLWVCIIPIDAAQFMKKCAAHSEQHFRKYELEMEYLTWDQAQLDHPLCIATNRVCTTSQHLNEKEKQSMRDQRRYLLSDASFVVIYRQFVNWRDVLQSVTRPHTRSHV